MKAYKFKDGTSYVRLPLFDECPWIWEDIVRKHQLDNKVLHPLIKEDHAHWHEFKAALRFRKAFGLETAGLKNNAFNFVNSLLVQYLRRLAIPYEGISDGSVYQYQRRNWYMRLPKTAVTTVEKLGFFWVPDGTFYGHQPKEYEYILVDIQWDSRRTAVCKQLDRLFK